MVVDQFPPDLPILVLSTELLVLLFLRFGLRTVGGCQRGRSKRRAIKAGRGRPPETANGTTLQEGSLTTLPPPLETHNRSTSSLRRVHN